MITPFAGRDDLVVQAVSVCVGFSDFLRETLVANAGLLDHWVIVTSPDDSATKQICRKLSIQCVEAHDLHIGGDKFNKGRAINTGLAHLSPGGWRLHLDADIALPPNFRQALRMHPLAKDAIYGADRINVQGFAAWQRVRSSLHEQYNHHFMVSPPSGAGVSLASRFVHHEWGYFPIGFFQLFHSSLEKRYPVNQGSAEHTDVTFANQWPREKRHLLPELFVCHLESEHGSMGVNWHGRHTKPFVPDNCPDYLK